MKVRKGLLDLAKWFSGDIIRLGGNIIRLMRLGDDTIKLIRLGDNTIKLVRLSDDVMRFINLSSDVIRLSIKYWENLKCLITIKRL